MMNVVVTRLFLLLEVIALFVTTTVKADNAYGWGPSISIASGLDDEDHGYCIDIRGFRATLNCNSLQAHSCKPQPSDTQFELYNMKSLRAVNYNSACDTITASENESSRACVTVESISIESTLGLADCDTESPEQTFDIVDVNNGYEIRIGDGLCLVVSSSSRSAGTIYKARDLYVDNCDSIASEFKTWAITPTPERDDDDDVTSSPEEEAILPITPSLCFPRDAMVYQRQPDDTTTTSWISMHELSIGDEILVDTNGTFETVYSFGHKNTNMNTEYLQFYTKEHKKLEISNTHMVSILRHEQQQLLLAAGQVVVGDYLQGRTSWEEITAIHTVTRKGAYAPFTTSGMLVVNGYVVSSYVALLEEIPYSLQQYLAHALQFPHRFLCHYNITEKCQSEAYDKDGISTWVAMPHRYIQQSMMGKPTVLCKYLFLMSMMLISIVFTIMETMMMHTTTTTTAMIIRAAVGVAMTVTTYYYFRLPPNKKA